MADELPTSGFYQYEENESGTGRWVKLDLQEFDPNVFTDKSASFTIFPASLIFSISVLVLIIIISP